MITEVVFKFEDGSDYTVRRDGHGDTIFGGLAHKVMFAMQKHEYGGNKLLMSDKIDFIVKYSES